MSLARTIEETKVAPGSVMCWWLGGAGFVFKTSSGTQVYIDPYFSNCVASIFGVDRAFPPPIRAEQARPDLVISTHWHEDHLDPEGLPIVARHSQAMFMAPPSCVSRLLGWLVPRDRVSGIKSGESHQFKDVKITGVAARHVVDTPGWEANDAIGIVLEFDELRVYHSGDTEYDLRLRAMAYDKDHPIHVCIIAINGTGGNMNAYEAALLAWQLGSRIVVPMHHRIWKDFTGGEQATVDPQVFVNTYRNLGGDGQVMLLEIGQGIELHL